MTYVHEHAAQFAKEAMMNQSLDQDEILNVRWATEDPNPSAIKREKRRVEQIGDEALRNKIVGAGDGRVVEAALMVEALERGDEAGLNAIPDGSNALEDGGSGKRLRIGAPVEGDDQEEERGGGAEGGGLIGSEALEGMRYLLELRKQAEAQKVETPKAASVPSAGGLGALGGYGSDSEEE